MNSQSRVQAGAISVHGPRKVISEEPHWGWICQGAQGCPKGMLCRITQPGFQGASDLALPAEEEAQHINLCAPRRHGTDETLENESSVRCFCVRVCETSEPGSSR